MSGEDPIDLMAGVLMTINDAVKPMHEWLDGQRSHFLRQGYTEDEARAMAAAMFVSVFGTNISRREG